MANLPTSPYTAAVNRVADYPARANGTTTDWAYSETAAGGLNAGGCSAGLGVSTGVACIGTSANPNPNWTFSDQDGNARDPQPTQYIGGNGVSASTGTSPNDGNALTTPILATKYATSDFNDQPWFVFPVGDVVAGGDLGGGVINLTGQTVLAQCQVWGVKPA